MDRQGKVDALFRSVQPIQDRDAFQYFIEREPDDYVLADLRDRFWSGEGEKPWQVKEINRALTRKKELRAKAQNSGNAGTQAHDASIKAAEITSRYQIIATAISSAALVVGAIIGRQTAPTRSDAQSGAANTPVDGCSAYHLVMLTPSNGALLTPPFQLKGTVDSLPKEISIWGVTTGDLKEEQYWPAAIAEVRDRQWTIAMPRGSSKPGDTKHIAVFVVGPDGRALIDFYRRAMNRTLADSTWIPLTRLTSDMDRCANLTVKVN